ncbi:response regulator transcription factor [uncultured Tateyamaria sp.]|uniref:response regulator transcription factor n=1 Tax=uncultured Tateyamaria sp. TaxID=455651 RepID=UPI002605F9D2|nr:response regulator transcription factor [uncultured Tateyamaria sp.]
MRIAIIEDNMSVAKGIAYRLEDRGHATDLIHDGADADTFLQSDSNDLIVLDVNLPQIDGLTVLRNLRARGDVRPVLLLTARAEIEARVAGLDAGADDYLTKPFDMDELEARIRALSRRRAQPIETGHRFGPLVFDTQSRTLQAAGAALDLPRRELAVVETMMSARGRVVSKADLIEHVYGTGADVEDSAIEVHVSRLRKRLRPHKVDIRAQRGLGYRLEEL